MAKRPGIGAHRYRVTIERKSGTPDGGGGLTDVTWTPVATVSAAFEPVSDRGRLGEVWHGGKLEDRVTHRFSMRAGVDVQGKDRLALKNRLFNVRRVASPDERGRFLDVLAEEGAAT